MNLSEIDTETLQQELYRRKNQTEINHALNEIQNKYGNPNNIWEVRTEGDCEGRTMRVIGVFQGHIADVYAYCYPRQVYNLYFKSICPPKIQTIPPDNIITEPIKFSYRNLERYLDKDKDNTERAFVEWLTQDKTNVKMINKSTYVFLESPERDHISDKMDNSR